MGAEVAIRWWAWRVRVAGGGWPGVGYAGYRGENVRLTNRTVGDVTARAFSRLRPRRKLGGLSLGFQRSGVVLSVGVSCLWGFSMW